MSWACIEPGLQPAHIITSQREELHLLAMECLHHGQKRGKICAQCIANDNLLRGLCRSRFCLRRGGPGEVDFHCALEAKRQSHPMPLARSREGLSEAAHVLVAFLLKEGSMLLHLFLGEVLCTVQNPRHRIVVVHGRVHGPGSRPWPLKALSLEV